MLGDFPPGAKKHQMEKQLIQVWENRHVTSSKNSSLEASPKQHRHWGEKRSDVDVKFQVASRQNDLTLKRRGLID